MNAASAIARRPPLEKAADPPIRLLIVDDSTIARAVLSRMLGADPDFEIAAVAGNADQALEQLKSVRVDIVLLDVEMPGGSGLDALPVILEAGAGARVLIVSSMADDGAETTVRALALGAADTLPKPGSSYFAGRFSRVLADRIRRIGRASRRAEATPTRKDAIRLRTMPEGPIGCIALGASTGGLHALIEFLRALPPAIGAPLLVTQHLPPIFMSHFARQLEAAAGRRAIVAGHGQRLIDDVVHIAPGDAHLCVERNAAGEIRARLDRTRASSNCLPSVDPMLASVADLYGDAAVGIVLSGMGRDGLAGARRLAERQGTVLAQDQASAAIWGMPRAVAEAGLASAVLPPPDLARRIALRAKGCAWK